MRPYRLRYFFDAGSGVCLWSDNDAARERYGIAITPAQLPLSKATRQEVNQLVAWYDTSLNWDDPAGPTSWSLEERESFNRAAGVLLTQLRAELRDFTIEDNFQPVS